MVTVKLNDLIDAYDFVSFGGPLENWTFISLETGEFIAPENSDDNEIPEYIEGSDRYVAVPHKSDLDLGRDLVFRFVTTQMPSHVSKVEGFFRSRGAYARFRDLLESERRLEAWRDFESSATEAALKEWCRENGLEVIENLDEETA